MIVLALPFGRYSELPKAPFAGKIVIDAGNYYPDRTLAEAAPTASARAQAIRVTEPLAGWTA